MLYTYISLLECVIVISNCHKTFCFYQHYALSDRGETVMQKYFPPTSYDTLLNKRIDLKDIFYLFKEKTTKF